MRLLSSRPDICPSTQDINHLPFDYYKARHLLSLPATALPLEASRHSDAHHSCGIVGDLVFMSLVFSFQGNKTI